MLEEKTFVVFTIAGYHLALPIEIIVQVIRHSAGADNQLNKAGLVQIGQHLIQVINLCPEVPAANDMRSAEQIGESQKFLIVMADLEKRLYGVVVNEPPNLIKLPLHKVQRLPAFNYQIPLLNMVSHIVQKEEPETSTTIFLVDGEKLSSQVELNLKC